MKKDGLTWPGMAGWDHHGSHHPMPKLGEPGHGEDGFTDLARYGWVGPTTVVTIPCPNWVSQDTEKMDSLTWPGKAGWDPPR